MTLLLLACTGVEGPDKTPEDSPSDTGLDCYADADRDGYGDAATPTRCRGNAVADATDCDDTADRVSPGLPEVCNEQDDDCDGLIDDADTDVVDGLPFYFDSDGDGFGGVDIVSACSIGDRTLVGGDCDDTDTDVYPGAPEDCDGVDRDCDGLAPTTPGSGSSCPAESCLAVLLEDTTATDGTFWIESPGGTTAAVWCDMTTDGGGWTLGFSRNSASTGSQGDFGYGDQAIDGLGSAPEAASSSATPILSWLDLNNVEWTELQLSAAYLGVQTYRSRTIPRSDLRISFGDDGYLLYGESGYYWCGGSAAYTDSGIGAVNNPDGAPTDCKYHGSLGSGWDFSESPSANAGLTLCGGDASAWISGSWGGSWVYYGSSGAAEAIWVR